MFRWRLARTVLVYLVVKYLRWKLRRVLRRLDAAEAEATSRPRPNCDHRESAGFRAAPPNLVHEESAIAPYGPVEKSPDASRGATAPCK
jgi:hypothetical protein